MKTKINLKGDLRSILLTVLVISGMALTSCSHHMCSTYAKSKDRIDFAQRIKNRDNGARSIVSPFTAQYKAKVYNRNF